MSMNTRSGDREQLFQVMNSCFRSCLQNASSLPRGKLLS